MQRLRSLTTTNPSTPTIEKTTLSTGAVYVKHSDSQLRNQIAFSPAAPLLVTTYQPDRGLLQSEQHPLGLCNPPIN